VREAQAAEVDKVLAEIGAGGIPQVLVWNKVDASGLTPGVERDEYGRIRRVFVSARTGAGLAELRGAVAEAAQARQARNPSPEPISL
jgi:GTP-binding protein HflX